MPECPLCSSPVARHGQVCNECDLERAFGIPEDHDDLPSQKKAKEADDR